MFKVNDTVMYGRNGACKVKDIQRESFGGAEKEYYILTPVYESNSTVYVPVEGAEVKLKKLLSKSEIDSVIGEASAKKSVWIEDSRRRREAASAVIKSGNHADVISLVKLYHAKKEEFEAANKKFFVADDRNLQEAESLLFQEFSIVLNIEKKDIFPLIEGKLKVSNA